MFWGWVFLILKLKNWTLKICQKCHLVHYYPRELNFVYDNDLLRIRNFCPISSMKYCFLCVGNSELKIDFVSGPEKYASKMDQK